MRSVGNGNIEFSELVHEVHLGYFIESMLADGFPMQFRVLTCASVGGATFHDRAVDFRNEFAYKLRLEIMSVSALTGGYLHGHIAGGLHSKGFENFYKALRGDFRCEINRGRVAFLRILIFHCL